LTPFTYTEYPSRLEFVPGLDKLRGKNVVWWTNEVKPTRRKSEDAKKLQSPSVSVVFREINNDSELGATFHVDIKLPYLTLLRVGTVVENSRCIGFSDSLSSLMVTLDQSSSGYKLINNVVDQKYSFKAYPIRRLDLNWFLEFKHGNNKTLLIPCLTYFTYCYGISAELKRILTTYSWREVKSRICGPLENIPKHRGLAVNLPKRLRDDDAVFVAHVLYDSHAEKVAMSLGSQLEVVYTPHTNRGVALRVEPWFREPMTAELLGVWITPDVYLALTFTGISEPLGEDIFLQRENSNLVANKSLGEGVGNAWKGALRPVSNIPLVVIHSDYDPHPNEAAIEINEPLLKILGERRRVYRVSKDIAKSSSGPKIVKISKGKAASGESDSRELGIAPLSQIPSLINHTNGILLNMWNAALFISGKYPTVLRKVEWYSLRHGKFFTDSPPQLIGLDKLSTLEKEQLPPKTVNWIYIDQLHQSVRGFLMMRLTVLDQEIYIVELERRFENRKREEQFQGLVFSLTPECELDELITRLKKAVRESCGVMSKALRLFKKAESFNHPVSENELVDCHYALVNALSKADIPKMVVNKLRPRETNSPIKKNASKNIR
jgi:hypothetical protein